MPWLIPQLSWLLFSPLGHCASIFINPEGQAAHGTLGIFLWVPKLPALAALLPWPMLSFPLTILAPQ